MIADTDTFYPLRIDRRIFFWQKDANDRVIVRIDIHILDAVVVVVVSEGYCSLLSSWHLVSVIEEECGIVCPTLERQSNYIPAPVSNAEDRLSDDANRLFERHGVLVEGVAELPGVLMAKVFLGSRDCGVQIGHIDLFKPSISDIPVPTN